MNFIQTYFQKRTNNMIAHQDFELAEQFVNIDFSLATTKMEAQKMEKLLVKTYFILKVFF
tara:strand:- start:5 stop:184 length:180 start_codon:yes stop_codon:yes gene_type:complete